MLQPRYEAFASRINVILYTASDNLDLLNNTGLRNYIFFSAARGLIGEQT
jgi:hypothetical protein